MLFILHLVARSEQEAGLFIADHLVAQGGSIKGISQAPRGGLIVKLEVAEDISDKLTEWARHDMATSPRFSPGKLLGFERSIDE